MKYIPGATYLGDGISGGSFIPGVPYRIVLHDTETMGLPGYRGGTQAPHATVDILHRRIWQHLPLTTAARALENRKGGVETNREGAIQFEIIGSCDPQSSILHLSNIPRDGWEWFAGKLRPIMSALSISSQHPTFLPYSRYAGGSYGDNGVRFSGQAWIKFNGICGHQHVPENVHGDPGVLPAHLWNALKDDDMQLTDTLTIPDGHGGTKTVTVEYVLSAAVRNATSPNLQHVLDNTIALEYQFAQQQQLLREIRDLLKQNQDQK